METYMTYAWDGYNSQMSKEIVPTMGQNTGMATGRAGVIFQMEEPMTEPMQQPSMFSSEDSPARTTQWQDNATDWLGTVERSGGSSIASYLKDAPDGLSARMSLASSVAEAVKISQQSSSPSQNSGIASDGVSLTLNTSEWPRDAAVCSLSQVLEKEVPLRFSLSAKACQGILRRADRRGKMLPPPLAHALKVVADSEPTPTSTAD